MSNALVTYSPVNRQLTMSIDIRALDHSHKMQLFNTLWKELGFHEAVTPDTRADVDRVFNLLPP